MIMLTGENCRRMIVALLLTETIIKAVSGSTCSYFEIKAQPPLTLSCDPYYTQQGRRSHTNSRSRDRSCDSHRSNTKKHRRTRSHTYSRCASWTLTFACEVEKLSSDVGLFDVHWFRQGIDNVVQDLGRIDTLNETPNEIEIAYGLHILNANFHETMLGDYWCQVMNTTHYFGMSNVLTILQPDKYDSDIPVCSEIARNETIKCADDPIPIRPTDIDCTCSMITETTKSMHTTRSLPVSPTAATSRILHNTPSTSATVELELLIMTNSMNSESVLALQLNNSNTDVNVLLMTTISISVLLLPTILIIIVIVVCSLKMIFRQRADKAQFKTANSLSKEQSLNSPSKNSSPSDASTISSKPNDYQPIDITTVDYVAVYTMNDPNMVNLQEQTKSNKRKLKQKETAELSSKQQSSCKSDIATTATSLSLHCSSSTRDHCIMNGSGHHYQPLDTTTVDYQSNYAEPSNDKRKNQK